MMYKRVYRYNKPEAAVLLDILNFTNKSSYTADQLVFGPPLRLDHTKTSVVISSSTAVNWRGEVEVEYHRHDLGTTFSHNPLVIDVDNVDDQSLFDGILEQFKVLFEMGKVVIVRTPLNTVITRQILDGVSYEDLVLPEDMPAPEPVERDGTFNFTLRALDNSLVWVGEVPLLVRRTAQLIDRSIATTLGIRKYLTDTLDTKVPIELIYDAEKDASEFGEVISERLHQDDMVVEGSPFLNIARLLTGDNWVAGPIKSDFNLYGSRVLYNGHNVGEYATGDPRFSHILVVALGTHCRNLKGCWTIQYRDPNVFHYDKCRVDLDSGMDR